MGAGEWTLNQMHDHLLSQPAGVKDAGGTPRRLLLCLVTAFSRFSTVSLIIESSSGGFSSLKQYSHRFFAQLFHSCLQNIPQTELKVSESSVIFLIPLF